MVWSGSSGLDLEEDLGLVFCPNDVLGASLDPDDGDLESVLILVTRSLFRFFFFCFFFFYS